MVAVSFRSFSPVLWGTTLLVLLTPWNISLNLSLSSPCVFFAKAEQADSQPQILQHSKQASPSSYSNKKERYFVFPKPGLFGTSLSQEVFSNSSCLTIHRFPSIGARAVDIAAEGCNIDDLQDHPLIDRVEKDGKRFPLSVFKSLFKNSISLTAPLAAKSSSFKFLRHDTVDSSETDNDSRSDHEGENALLLKKTISALVTEKERQDRASQRHLQNGEDGTPPAILEGETVPYGVSLIGADVTPLAPKTRRQDLLVCVLDSGVNSVHEDLKGGDYSGLLSSSSLSSRNVTALAQDNSQKWQVDTCGHGTHVTGTIDAIRGNGKGIVGVASGVAVHFVKLFDGPLCDWVWTSDILSGIQQCQTAAKGARLIINLSLGGSDFVESERLGYEKLWKAGVLTIAAAGNSGTTDYAYPASYPSVISVAAVDSELNVADFSQRNDQVDLAAPGVGILSTYLDNGYASLDGTSMAAPYVVGAAALTWSYGRSRGWTNADVRKALETTAKDINVPGKDSLTGSGFINACKAAEQAGFVSSNGEACPP